MERLDVSNWNWLEKRKALAFDLGEVDLIVPWKYYYCPEYEEGINKPCSP